VTLSRSSNGRRQKRRARSQRYAALGTLPAAVPERSETGGPVTDAVVATALGDAGRPTGIGYKRSSAYVPVLSSA